MRSFLLMGAIAFADISSYLCFVRGEKCVSVVFLVLSAICIICYSEGK